MNYWKNELEESEEVEVGKTPTAPGVVHPMVAELLAAAERFRTRTDSFAQGKYATCHDLAQRLIRSGDFASDKQAEFAAKLVMWSKPRQEAPGSAPAEAAGISVPRLFEVLQRHATFHAGQLRISRRNGDTLCWLVWDTTCVGRIADGVATLFSGRLRGLPEVEGMSVEANIAATLQEFNRDPLETAKAYGRLSGRCCSCGLELTNPKSIEAGIGPICAKRFG